MSSGRKHFRCGVSTLTIHTARRWHYRLVRRCVGTEDGDGGVTQRQDESAKEAFGEGARILCFKAAVGDPCGSGIAGCDRDDQAGTREHTAFRCKSLRACGCRAKMKLKGFCSILAKTAWTFCANVCPPLELDCMRDSFCRAAMLSRTSTAKWRG